MKIVTGHVTSILIIKSVAFLQSLTLAINVPGRSNIKPSSIFRVLIHWRIDWEFASLRDVIVIRFSDKTVHETLFLFVNSPPSFVKHFLLVNHVDDEKFGLFNIVPVVLARDRASDWLKDVESFVRTIEFTSISYSVFNSIFYLQKI